MRNELNYKIDITTLVRRSLISAKTSLKVFEKVEIVQ